MADIKKINPEVFAWASTNNIKKVLVDYILESGVSHHTVEMVARWVNGSVEEFIQLLKNKNEALEWYASEITEANKIQDPKEKGEKKEQLKAALKYMIRS